MAEIKDLSTTDANNTGTAANAGFPENMAYSDVNNAARALEGMIARHFADSNGTLTTTGSSNAYLLTPNRTVAAYAAGDAYMIKASFTNTGAVTINVSSLGAKSIVKPSGDALAAGELTSGGIYAIIYDGTNFQMAGADDPENLTLTSLTVTGTTALNGNTTIGDAASDTVTITADVASDLIPSADGTHDLGAVGSEWQDLFIDGTANIDSLVADTADIDSGTIDGTVIGGSTAAAITGTTITANTSLNIAGDGATVTGIKDEDDMASDSATKLATQQSIKAYVDNQVTAQDLDFQADSGGALSVDLDSQTFTLTGGTGIDTSGSGQTVTFDIDSTVATLTGSQTLTNKTLTSPVLNTGVSGTAVLDEDNMASDSNTQLATQQSIKAYVDAQITAEDLDFQADSGGALSVDLDSQTFTLTGGTGIDTVGANQTVTFAIDSTVTTLTGTQTLTNKTLTSPVLDTSVSGTAVLDEDNMASDSATKLATQQSIKAYVDAQLTAEDLDFQADSGGALSVDLDSQTFTLTGGTGIDTSGSGQTVTFDIDSTVATLTGTQTLTNKTLTTPTLTGTAVVASLDISGDIDVDGTTNLDVVDIDGAVDMASTLQVTGNLTLGADVIATDFDVDASGDINLDAGGGDWRLKDDGTTIATISNVSGDLQILLGQDKDYKFQIDDSGTGQATALLLDGAEGGIATFGSGINIGNRGSASDPTLQSSIDPNTGVYWGGSDILGLSSGGAEKFRVSGDGASAKASHTVTDVTNANSNMTLSLANSGVGDGVFNALAFNGNQQDMYIMSFNDSTQADRRIGFFVGSVAGDAATDERLSIKGDGSVGIGTNSPSARATIKTASNEEDAILIEQSDGTDVGSIRINNGSFLIKGKSSSAPVQLQTHDGNEDIEVDPDGFIKMETAGVERLRINANGSVGLGTADGDVTSDGNAARTYVGIIGTANRGRLNIGTTASNGADAATLAFTNGANSLAEIVVDTNSGVQNAGKMYISSTDEIRFSTAGSQRMALNSSGNFNIGMPANYNAEGKLHVYNGASGKSYSADTADQIILENSGSVMMDIRTPSSNTGGILFSDADARGRGVIQYAHSNDTLYFTAGAAAAMDIDSSGVNINGSLSKGSGSFKINHPLPAKTDTHHLVHSFVEAPQADNIYRGSVDLVGGSATVNIDTAAGMTEGTFVLLNTNVQCFTSNESGWTAIKGSVSGNTLTITAQDNACTDTISWMVVGERQDQHMLETDWTDENGKVIVEPAKPVIEE